MNEHYTKRDAILPLLLASLVITCCVTWLYYRTQLERRAARGKAESQYELAKCYYYGLGMRRNSIQAAAWFRLAAAQGHAEAQTALGIMYVTGDGVPQNYELAVKLLREAAQKGIEAAQNQLGLLYAQGRGVPQDLDEATNWFSHAADQGSECARQNLRLIAATRPTYLERLTLRNGRTYEEVRLQKVELDGLTITYHPHQGGVGLARLSFRDLPEELQAKYSFTATNGPHLASSGQLAAVVLQSL